MKAALMCGLTGSTILVTTRKDKVALIMGCRESNILPPGHLSEETFPPLSHLDVSGMKKKRMDVEFWGIDETFLSVVAFPKLEYLVIASFEEWEEWDMDNWGHFIVMPCFTTLNIHDCNNLEALPDLLLQKTTLKSFTISDCSLLVERYKEHGVDWPKISHMPYIFVDGIVYPRGIFS